MPMVVVSHDREFLDQLCTKIVHTEFGLAHTFRGNYTKVGAQHQVQTAPPCSLQPFCTHQAY